MWHVEGFDAVADTGELQSWLTERFLPYFREQGFLIRVFMTQAGLGPRQFWLATEIERFGDIDSWAARAGDEGARLIAELLARTTRLQGAVVSELEPVRADAGGAGPR